MRQNPTFACQLWKEIKKLYQNETLKDKTNTDLCKQFLEISFSSHLFGKFIDRAVYENDEKYIVICALESKFEVYRELCHEPEITFPSKDIIAKWSEYRKCNLFIHYKTNIYEFQVLDHHKIKYVLYSMGVSQQYMK